MQRNSEDPEENWDYHHQELPSNFQAFEDTRRDGSPPELWRAVQSPGPGTEWRLDGIDTVHVREFLKRLDSLILMGVTAAVGNGISPPKERRQI